MAAPDPDHVAVIARSLGAAPGEFHVHDDGMDTVAYETVDRRNDAWIFRFAREAWMLPRLAAESVLLDAIADRLPAPVPRHVFRGEGFAGYRKIEGEPLTWEMHAAFAPAARARAADDLGRFLRALHVIPTSVAEAAGVTRDGGDGREDPAEQAQRFERFVGPVLTPDLLGTCKDFYAAYHAWAARQAVPEVILHNDLILMTHALMDPDTGALGGIIDFGDAAIGDPALDLAAIAVELPEPFLDAVLEAYGDTSPGFRERAFWHGRRYLLADSIWMWEYGVDPEGQERRLERIRHHFGHNPPSR